MFYFPFRNKEQFLTLLNSKNSDKVIPLSTSQDVNDQTPAQVCFNLDFISLALLEKCLFKQAFCRHLHVQIQQYKHWKKLRNTFKVNNKDTERRQ